MVDTGGILVVLDARRHPYRTSRLETLSSRLTLEGILLVLNARRRLLRTFIGQALPVPTSQQNPRTRSKDVDVVLPIV